MGRIVKQFFKSWFSFNTLAGEMVIHLISFLMNVLEYIMNNSPMHVSFILFILTS